MGDVVMEKLPLPVVLYSHVFLAFAKDESSPAAFCACTKPAVANYIRLRQVKPTIESSDPIRSTLLDSYSFPRAVVEFCARCPTDPMSVMRFEKELCHRCNLNLHLASLPTVHEHVRLHQRRFLDDYLKCPCAKGPTDETNRQRAEQRCYQYVGMPSVLRISGNIATHGVEVSSSKHPLTSLAFGHWSGQAAATWYMPAYTKIAPLG